MPLVMASTPAVELGAPLAPQHQRGETLSYLVGFAVLCPLALLAAQRLAPALAGRAGDAGLSALLAVLAAGLLGAIVLVKALERAGASGGVLWVLGAAAVWWTLAAALVARTLRPRPWRVLAALGPHATLAWGAVAAVGLVAVLCFAVLGSIDRVALAVGLVAAAIATAIAGRVVLPVPGRRWGRVLDVLVLLAVLALVPDLLIFRPEAAAAGDLAAALETGIVQFHHDFLLGPANEVLHGHPMLAPTASQYGVTSIYLLAAWFQLAPIGYGTLGLLTGALTALWFGAGYGILRLAGTARLLSATALGVAVVALAYNLTYPVGALPQSGPLRFGLPMALVLCAVVAARRPERPRPWDAAALVVLGLSAVWSLESFAYTAAVFAVLACLRARLDAAARRAAAVPRTRRGRRSARMRRGASRVRARHARRVRSAARLGRVPRLPARVPVRHRRRPHLRRRALDARPRGRRRLRRLGARDRRAGAPRRRARATGAPGARRAHGHDGLRHRAAELLRRPLAEPHPGARRAAGAAHRGALARAAAARGSGGHAGRADRRPRPRAHGRRARDGGGVVVGAGAVPPHPVLRGGAGRQLAARLARPALAPAAARRRRRRPAHAS